MKLRLQSVVPVVNPFENEQKVAFMFSFEKPVLNQCFPRRSLMRSWLIGINRELLTMSLLNLLYLALGVPHPPAVSTSASVYPTTRFFLRKLRVFQHKPLR